MEERFWNLLTRYVSRESSLEEYEELMDLVASQDRYGEIFANISEVWDLNHSVNENSFDTDGLKYKVMKAVKAKDGRGILVGFPAYGIAATVVLFIVSAVLIYNGLLAEPDINYITESTRRGQKADIVLSDGTRVRLNTESSVTYPEEFSGKDRTISLSGEAFFSVTRDESRPFKVVSGDLITMVLGTSFNINAFPDEDITVTVASGKVNIWSPSSADSVYTLSPNQQCVLDISAGHIERLSVNIDHFLAWKEDVIVLNEISLKEAATILERWYDVSIIFESKNTEGCLISGKYRSDEITNILESMKFLKGIEYRFVDKNNLIISGGNCK